MTVFGKRGDEFIVPIIFGRRFFMRVSMIYWVGQTSIFTPAKKKSNLFLTHDSEAFGVQICRK